MSYAPIELDPGTVPESIRFFVPDRVEPYLRDVRVMLEAPSAADRPGFNMSIAVVLCGVIGGLSRVFYNDLPKDGESFRAVAQRYPMEDEPARAFHNLQSFANELYGVYRCGLVHSLGLHMERADPRRWDSPWTIADVGERYVVARSPSLPLDERQLAELDAAVGRPPWLYPILARVDSKIRLDVDALYWGVRRIVRSLSHDPPRQIVATAVLEDWHAAIRTPHRTVQMTSSGTPVVTTSAYAMDATLGATASVSSYWAPLSDGKKKG